MYLSAYHFDGDPEALCAAHDLLMSRFPPDAVDLHVCVCTPRGILVLDGCPSRADFEAFSTGDEFRTALAAVGLPQPRIEEFGDVHTMMLGRGAVSR